MKKDYSLLNRYRQLFQLSVTVISLMVYAGCSSASPTPTNVPTRVPAPTIDVKATADAKKLQEEVQNLKIMATAQSLAAGMVKATSESLPTATPTVTPRPTQEPTPTITTDPTPVLSNTHRSPYGFSLDYPLGWQISEYSEDLPYQAWVSHEHSDSSAGIFVDHDPNATLEDMLDDLTLENGLGYDILSVKRRDSLPGYLVNTINWVNGEGWPCRTLITVSQEWNITAIFCMNKDHHEILTPIMDAMIDSFELYPPTIEHPEPTPTAIPVMANNWFPSWAPDGLSIIYSSDLHGNNEIFTLDLASKNSTRLTNNTYNDVSPAWSPNGHDLAFVSQRNSATNFDIYIMSKEGSETRMLPDNTANSTAYPRWSPDGSKIVFTTMTGDSSADIYTINADGSNLTNLTNNDFLDVQPCWSPDGSKIAFASDRDGDAEIYIMDLNTQKVTRITSSELNDYDPDWSPNGQNIAFVSEREWEADIYTIKTDGSGLTKLTDSQSDEYNPRWSPDGSKILFTSNKDGHSELYTMLTDGSSLEQITEPQLKE